MFLFSNRIVNNPRLSLQELILHILFQNKYFPVGVNPKGLAFTSDCQKLIIANEGRGDMDEIARSFVDPPGTVTIMLRNDVGSPAVVTISFDLFLAGRYFYYSCIEIR